MIASDTLVNVFIDANILLIVAFTLWNVARFGLNRFGVKHAYMTELHLLNGVFIAIIASPVVILAIDAIQSFGIAKNVSVNFSDMVVSHYLNGGLQMSASKFERLLLARDTFTQDVVGAAGWVAQLAIAAFLTGLVVGTGRFVFSALTLRRIVAKSHSWRRFGRVRVQVSDTTLVPFSTRGLRNYYVVLPSDILTNKKELSVSLAHEFQHLRQGDIEWEILLEILKPIFFLNPAFHAWKRKVEDLRELACDGQVIARGRICVREYCETLLAVCQQTLRKDRSFVAAVPKVTLVTAERSTIGHPKESLLERRISSMLSAQRLDRPRWVFVALALPISAATIFFAVAIQSPGDWSHDRLMLSTVVNLERLDEINRLSATATWRR